MANPTYVNDGGITGALGASTAAPTIAPSIVAGNLLLAWVQFSGVLTLSSISSGWTLGGYDNSGGQSQAWAWKIAAGSDTTCTFTFSGVSFAWHGRCLQFTNNLATGAWLGTNSVTAGSSTTAAKTGVLMSANNSLVLALILSSDNVAIATPASYTQRATYNDGNSSDEEVTQNGPAQATACTNISVTVPNNPWGVWMIEIRSQLPTSRRRRHVNIHRS